MLRLHHRRLLKCQVTFSKHLCRSLSTAASEFEPKDFPLAGTVPYHSAYLFLHAKQSPRNFPKKLDSDLYLRLKNEASKWEKKCLVNMRYLDSSSSSENATSSTASNSEEMFEATLHVGRMETHDLRITSSTLDSTLSFIESRIQSIQNPSDSPTLVQDSRRLYIYVCTHAAVDCRCGENGPKFVKALKDELARLKSKDLLKDRYWRDVKIMETGHIGGHKYAANALAFPHSDWYGTLTPVKAPAFLHHLLKTQPYTLTHSLNPFHPCILRHWRGRMGLTPENQKRFVELNMSNIPKEEKDSSLDLSGDIGLVVFDAFGYFSS